MNILNNNKGFTLLELLAAFAISIIVLLGMYTIYLTNHRSYIFQHEIADMELNARASSELLVRELRNAVVIDSNSTITNLTFYTDSSDSEIGISSGSNTSNTLNDVVKLWTNNEWQGMDVAIASGTGTGQVRSIISNTSDQLIVSPAWSNNPDDTSVYHIDVIEKSFSWSSGDNILRYSSDSNASAFSTDITNFALNQSANKIDIQITTQTAIKDPGTGQYRTYTVNCPIAFRN